ncbi:MAG: ADOP family duplicated permease [Vicinamibacterales bacterium]
MRIISRLAMLRRDLFGSRGLDRQMDEEMQFHFDREVQANRERGLSLDEARRQARLTIGSPEAHKESSRDARAGALIRQFGRDLAQGARLFRKAPGFSAACIAVVALGIGAVTAIFSVVYGVALEPLPFREPERLVALWTRAQKLGQTRIQVNGADHRDWQAANHVFDDIALVRNIANFNLTGNREPERLFGARISANLFPVLGVEPAIGRGFTEDEDEIGNERRVILSDGLWRRRFGADPSIVGREIGLSGVPHLVVGVMRPDFQYPGREFQVWTPLTINPDELSRKLPGYCCLAVARLKRGVDVTQAQSEMDTIGARLASAYPFNKEMGVTFEVVQLHGDLVAGVGPALYVMLGAVVCLLLIACLNLSSLLGARAAAQRREVAVRLALGATRGRVALQSLAESIPLLLVGGILGVAIATWAVAAFLPLAPANLPRVENIQVSGAVLTVSVLALMFTGSLASVLPTRQAWNTDLTAATREEGRWTTGGRAQSRARSVLVATQIALALPLLVGAGLLTRSFVKLTEVNPGFRVDNTFTTLLAIPRSKYLDDRQVAAFTDRLLEQVAAIPEVASAGLVSRLPLGGVGAFGGLEFDAPEPKRNAFPSVDWRSVSPGYFQTIGIPLLEGRLFDSRDVDGAEPVGIVDERIARTVWPGESAVDKRFRIPFAGQPWVRIVGVVGHIQHDGLDVEQRPQAYWTYQQRAQDRMALVARARGDSRNLGRAVLQAVHAIDPEQPVYDTRMLSEVVDRSLSSRWLNLTLITSFATMALFLSCIGVYGVIAFGVAQQRREFGIRVALGASRVAISRLVLARGLLLSGAGAAIGLVLAALLAQTMQALLYGVGVSDLVSFGAATATLMSVALLASYLPARRAAAVDPASTLRSE